MSRRLGMAALLAVAALAAAASGCHTCEDHEGSNKARELAQLNFDNEKFDQAKMLYSRCVEKCPDNEMGWLGLANACRAYGNSQFKAAADLASQGKINDSRRVFKEAVENHAMAFKIFTDRLAEKPDDLAPRYGLGLLYYDRATSVVPFPFPLDDAIHRAKERDLAIAEWTLIVAKQRDAWQAHRYLGLLLFAAGRMDEGRVHLMKFHDAQQALYEKVLTWPNSTDDEKKIKENNLKRVEKEITDIRDLMGEYLINLQHEIEKLKSKRVRTPEEDQKLAHLATESVQLEGVFKGFHLTNLGPVEQELRRRCEDYLTVFNRGDIGEIMSFISARKGEEAAMQRAVQERLDAGTKYRRPQYRTIVVSGSTASVGLVCEVINRKGNRPDMELTMHWRLVGGQWKVSDLP